MNWDTDNNYQADPFDLHASFLTNTFRDCPASEVNILFGAWCFYNHISYLLYYTSLIFYCYAAFIIHQIWYTIYIYIYNK